MCHASCVKVLGWDRLRGLGSGLRRWKAPPPAPPPNSGGGGCSVRPSPPPARSREGWCSVRTIALSPDDGREEPPVHDPEPPSTLTHHASHITSEVNLCLVQRAELSSSAAVCPEHWQRCGWRSAGSR